MQTYLHIKNQQGRDGDYSVIDNESILASYGIKIPEREPQPVPQEQNIEETKAVETET